MAPQGPLPEAVDCGIIATLAEAGSEDQLEGMPPALGGHGGGAGGRGGHGWGKTGRR